MRGHCNYFLYLCWDQPTVAIDLVWQQLATIGTGLLAGSAFPSTAGKAMLARAAYTGKCDQPIWWPCLCKEGWGAVASKDQIGNVCKA